MFVCWSCVQTVNGQRVVNNRHGSTTQSLSTPQSHSQSRISRRVRKLQPTPSSLRLAQETPPAIQPEQITPRVQLSSPQSNTTSKPSRLPLLPGVPQELVDPPLRAEVQKEYSRFVQRTIDPELSLELLVGRPRILEFKEIPTRIYLAQDSIASYDIISDKTIAVVGVAPGRTVLTIWVNDPDNPGKQQVLSYLLRVTQDVGYKVRLESVYQALEKEINSNFPDSLVKLSLIGDQLVVRGQAKDVLEATQIIRIASEHAPPSRDKKQSQERGNLSISRTSFTTTGSLEIDEEVDTEDFLATLKGNFNVINMLTIPGEQQVMLRVTVAEVDRSSMRAIGSSLRIEGSSGVGVDAAFPPRVGDLVDTSLLVLEGGTFSVARGDFRLTIDALKQHGLARTLAEPNLVTLHGRPANFTAGGQFPVPSAQVGFGTAAQGVQFIPFGVLLQFIPYIMDRDKIRLNISAEVSATNGASGTEIDGSFVPGLNTNNFRNTVELREGQTLAVAGLIKSEFRAISSRVPGFGDLPVIGRLFKSDSTTAREQELVILITPELVHPVDPPHLLPLPGSDVFEPSDVEYYIQGFLESRRSNDYRSTVRTDWERMKRYHHCEDMFIIGPHGHADGRQNPGAFQTPPASAPDHNASRLFPIATRRAKQ